MSQIDPVSAMIDATRAALQEHLPARRWHYSEQSDTMSEAQFRELINRCPHVAIAWAGWPAEARAGKRYAGRLALRIWIVVKHTHLTGRFRGDAAGPGLYPAMATAIAALHGLTLDGIGTLSVTSAAPAFAQGFLDNNIAVGLIELSTPVHMPDVLGAVEALPPFAGLDVDWDLARGAGHAEAPDAQDEITLNEEED